MTPYDYTKMLVAFEDGAQVFEKRRKRIITSSTGEPLRMIPDGVDATTWMRTLKPGERVEWASVLVRVQVPAT